MRPDPRSAPRSDSRREPGFGAVEGLRFQRRLGARMRGGAGWGGSGRWLLWCAIALGLALLIGLIVLRRPLADWFWPETRAQALREQAVRAQARGHLSATDGSGARELYEAAIAIDPDSNEAHRGLAQVAQAALAQARAALARDDFAAAHRAMKLARELQVPRAQADVVATRLRAREADLAGIDALLQRATAAHAQGRLHGDGAAALPLYQRILSLRPKQIHALEGREDALADLLQQARAALSRGDLVTGAGLIEAALGYDPGHTDLPQAQGEVTRAIEALHQRADRDLKRGALDRAASGYQELLTIDPDHAAAARGLDAVAKALVADAERAAADFDFAAAQTALERAEGLGVDRATLGAAQRKLASARQARAQLRRAQAPAPGGAARVARLLEEARAAKERGDLLTPPGESAYDKLRAAAAIAPSDPELRRAQRRLVPAARACFERELPRNALGRARACLDTWAILEGEGSVTRQARRRLALRWLAVGDERLSAGELEAARDALTAARDLDADVPGLAEFRSRLDVAAQRR